jgi:hypothetical protein
MLWLRSFNRKHYDTLFVKLVRRLLVVFMCAKRKGEEERVVREL